MIDGVPAVDLPEYHVWMGIRDRTSNPECRDYEKYGARGIGLHPDWAADFSAFLSYLGRRPTPRHSVGRIDNDVGYIPGNVRWETPEQQSRNKRNSRLLTHPETGESKMLVEWCEALGITASAMQNRLRRMPIEKALTLPSKSHGKSNISPEKERELVDFFLEPGNDYSTEDLAEIFKTTRKTVENVLIKHGARSKRIALDRSRYGPSGAERVPSGDE
jgi:hypothetical protein